jgi:hypothetical protein
MLVEACLAAINFTGNRRLALKKGKDGQEFFKHWLEIPDAIAVRESLMKYHQIKKYYNKCFTN